MRAHEAMRKRIIQLIVPAFMLIGLPLAGIIVSGHDFHTYLEFPPTTKYVSHAPFSMPVFCGLSVFILAWILPVVYRCVICVRSEAKIRGEKHFSLPCWGYTGLAALILSWTLAWTRFHWFRALQPFTFLPLWLSFIVCVNALTEKRKGVSLMTEQPRIFLCLFPASAVFWWFFEYLNRFVQNWYYVEAANLGPVGYFLVASASFSTVLPAVLSTRELLLSFPFFEKAFGNYAKLNCGCNKLAVSVFLGLSALGLACIGSFPDYLFPLVWVSPVILLVSLQSLANQQHILSGIAEGRWTTVVASALSALICGFFWEMWNYFSMAKWIYSIPYVQRFHLFEMPLLGYAGYLPFGLECAVAAEILLPSIQKPDGGPDPAEGPAHVSFLN